MSAACTSGRPWFAVPTAEGIIDAMQAIEATMKAGKWTLIAPDGRVWINEQPMILFAALASIMRGEELKFDFPQEQKGSAS